eukprot:CAMPEP_0176041666 /NCGR_PEP_ID=MMETSP0120_2-20121206/20668_1 /TAXON_ID=160619 /ORGANISM="Kryptoperidinium foliaceum, Strain CCMP 1326" /LENGTH=633 /DNA_ID=CAMNT_0017375069 /DNA_START=36 /DNA_END=1935 /DNA_ORIENTATION=+
MNFGGVGGGAGNMGGQGGFGASNTLATGMMPTGTMPTGAMQMGGMQQMQMQMGMLGVPMGLPMGMPMVGMMGMGMPMGVSMGMGMGMMGMPLGVSPLLAAAAQHEQNKSEAEAKKEQLLKALEAAGEQLAARESKASSTSQRRDDAESRAGGSAASSSTAGASEAPPKCHLHRKPNPKCKFCQKAELQSAAKAAASVLESVVTTAGGEASGAERHGADGGGGGERSAHVAHGAHVAEAGRDDDENYSRRTFNCSPMLKDQILSSSYFKSLLSIENIEDLIEEIAQYADTLDVYNAGSNTQPSCFICQAYRLFTMPKAEDLSEVQAILDYPHSAVVRCVGFVYMRFVLHPNHLWGKLEEYLFDTMELVYSQGGKPTYTTIGEYVEQLLIRDRYFNTPFPRIPVKVRQMLEKELAPLHQYRKRMEANRRTFKGKKVADMPVEVCVDGRWVGRRPTVGVEEAPRAVGRRRRRQRAPRQGGPPEPLQERLRQPLWRRGRLQEAAAKRLAGLVAVQGRIGAGDDRGAAPPGAGGGDDRPWPRVPEEAQHVDMGLAQKFERGSHEQRLLEEDRSAHDRGRGDHKQPETEATRRHRLEEEDKRQKKLRDIYEKYGAQQQKTSAGAGYGASTGAKRNVDVE